MKMNITCPKCGSPNITFVENLESNIPMYRCDRCGHKQNLFPQFGKQENDDEDM